MHIACVVFIKAGRLQKGMVINMALLAGVYKAKKKSGTPYYRSSITYRNKHISLGSFPTEQEAHEAYLAAGSLLQNETLLTPEDYSSSPLPFPKWVCLTNFKNNGLYIGTPIYLRSSFFHYYLSQTDILLFDVDDLFYYSHHSIMRRGNHLFVSDYGMQVNIASRYGIKSFAAVGRDFRFVNGNDHDWRYENIQIINAYNGVSRIPDTYPPAYVAKIHVNGDWIIGRYPSEEEAAIAYNKAADLLAAAGIKTRYTANYLPEMPAAQYKDIYTRIPIREQFLHYVGTLG